LSPHLSIMDQGPNQTQLDRRVDEEDKDESEALELILFHLSECYVYMVSNLHDSNLSFHFNQIW